MKQLLLLLLYVAAAGMAAALDFEMQTQTKCIFEELNANVIVVGDYNAANKDNPSLPIYVDVKVGGQRRHVQYCCCCPACQHASLCFRCLTPMAQLCMRTRHKLRDSLLLLPKKPESTRLALQRMVRRCSWQWQTCKFGFSQVPHQQRLHSANT